MPKLPQSVLAAGAVVLVAAASASMAAALASNGRRPRLTIPAQSHDRVSPRLYRAFGVLRGHHARARSASTLGMSDIGGVDPSAAVTVEGAYVAVVIPGETEVCIENAPTGMTAAAAHAAGLLGGVCGTISAAEARGIAETTQSASGKPVVIGLVPNGNTSVEVTNVDGTTESVPVTDNVYEITTGSPTAVTMRDAAGQVIIRNVAILSHPSATAPAG